MSPMVSLGPNQMGNQVCWWKKSPVIFSTLSQLLRHQAQKDAVWPGDNTTQCSTKQCLFTLCGGALNWKSRLKPTLVLSSTEAEYPPLRQSVEAGPKLLWLRKMLIHFGFSSKLKSWSYSSGHKEYFSWKNKRHRDSTPLDMGGNQKRRIFIGTLEI